MSIPTFLLIFSILAAVNAECPKNETQGFVLSCEYTCRDLSKTCVMKSKCICEPGLYRDTKTFLCVEKRHCSNHTYLYIREKIIEFLNKILSIVGPYVPSQIRNMIQMLTTANKARKFVMGLQQK